jgi:putative multiple sugar transport system permease protein
MNFHISDIKKMFGGGTSSSRQFGMIFTLIAIIAFFQWQTNGLTLDPVNLIAIVSQYSYILILAIGMVMVIIAGNIDLSVGSIAAVAGIVVAKAMYSGHWPWWAAILLGLVLGAVIGAWQGFWVAYVGIPAFIVTLAGMLLFRGMNQFIGNAQSIPVPEAFRTIGAGYLPEVGPNTGYNNLTLLLGLLACIVVVVREFRIRRTQTEMDSSMAPVWVSVVKTIILVGVIAWMSMLFAGGRVGTSFPVSGIILAALVILYSFITNSTIFGRHIYAFGGNRLAAQLSGVKSKRVNFMIMMNMAILASLAGMIFVARSAASGPQDGVGWELDAIAAVFIGGAAVAGGVGTVTGSIVGGLVMAVLNNGMQLMGLGTDRVQMIKGLVLLLAVAVDVYNKTQGRTSIIGYLTRNFSKRDETAETAVQVAPTPSEAVRQSAATPN